MARQNTVPVLLAVTVAGGLTLGANGIANAQSHSSAPGLAAHPDRCGPGPCDPVVAGNGNAGGTAREERHSNPPHLRPGLLSLGLGLGVGVGAKSSAGVGVRVEPAANAAIGTAVKAAIGTAADADCGCVPATDAAGPAPEKSKPVTRPVTQPESRVEPVVKAEPETPSQPAAGPAPEKTEAEDEAETKPPVDAEAGPVDADTVVEPVVPAAVREQRPTTVPETQVVAQPSDHNGGWPTWNQPAWGGGNGPGVRTNNQTPNGNAPAQPVVAPLGTGGNAGIAPAQNAAHSAPGAPQAAPGAGDLENTPEEEPEETSGEDAPEKTVPEAPMRVTPEEAEPAGGPAGGAALPFTGAPMGVAAAGAGLLATALSLGCALLFSRRRRSADAE